MTDVPRGKYIGNSLGASPGDEADHFVRCPVCDGWIDCRDLLRSSSMKARSHTLHRIDRNERRSVRNPNRRHVAQLP